MAKPLNERIANALSNDNVRTHDLEKLIGEIEGERDRLTAAHAAASSESVDFALNEADREDAAAKAGKYARGAETLANALVRIRERLDERRESENSQAAETERAAAIAERDALAKEFGAFVPQALDRLVDLLRKVAANEQRLRAAGAAEPNAEAKARGVTGFLGYAGQVESYSKMKIPAYSKAGRMWPVDEHSRIAAQVAADYSANLARQKAEAREAAERKRKEAEEHARLHGQYRLSTGLVGYEAIRLPKELIAARMPRAIEYGMPWTGEVPHAVAEKLREVQHLDVQALTPVPAK